MNTDLQLKVELLTDKTRLHEIFDLRVFAWENSSMNQFINREYFPNGWSDQKELSLEGEELLWLYLKCCFPVHFFPIGCVSNIA